MICLRCGEDRVYSRRGLCSACHRQPGIRDLYPSTSMFARRGIAIGFNVDAPLPEPTEALPGSAEKAAVMSLRAERGEQLHHPEDPKVTHKERPGCVPGLQTLGGCL